MKTTTAGEERRPFLTDIRELRRRASIWNREQKTLLESLATDGVQPSKK